MSTAASDIQLGNEVNLYARYQEEKRISILSLDGGGVKGILSAMVLEEIEKRTESAVSDLFSLISGTSTGAISAIGLTIPKEKGLKEPKYKAQEIVSFYEMQTAKVFPEKNGCCTGLCKRAKESKYSSKGMEKVVDQLAGGVLFQDLITEVMVPAWEMTRARPWRFLSTDEKLKEISIKDIILATTAAPTYYNPKKLTINGENLAFIDGGIFANNPSVSAYTTVKGRLPNFPEDRFQVVSIGTGLEDEKVVYKGNKGWGVLEWAPRIGDLFLQAHSLNSHHDMLALLPGKDEKQKQYFYIQTHIEEKLAKFDDASDENIADLKEKGYAMIEENDSSIRDLCRQLKVDKK